LTQTRSGVGKPTVTHHIIGSRMNNNGQWRLASITPVIIISSGLVYTSMTKPKGLTLADILEMIKEHPRAGYYEKRLRRRVTLGDALAQGKFNELGREVAMVSSIDLIRLEQHDRVFSKVPLTGQQLLSKRYSSRPRGR